MARSWTEEEILVRLEKERGRDALRTLEEFRRRLAQEMLDTKASIEWLGSSKRTDEHATLWPWVVYESVFYYPPACFRVDGEVEVPVGYTKKLTGRWNKEFFLRENRERTPFSDEEKRRKLLDRINEIPGVILPDSVDGRPTFGLRLLRSEEAADRLVEVFNWYIGEIADHGGSAAPTDETHVARLRRRALKAASQGVQRGPRETTRRYHERSAAVREYVLARAAGTCESCGSPAPFSRPDGTSYLEPHHTTKLSDGGPDEPRSVGAICPNCHNEIHHGAAGDEKNQRLRQRLAALEDGTE